MATTLNHSAHLRLNRSAPSRYIFDPAVARFTLWCSGGTGRSSHGQQTLQVRLVQEAAKHYTDPCADGDVLVGAQGEDSMCALLDVMRSVQS